MININISDLDSLISEIAPTKTEKENIPYLFEVMKKLPASVNGYHGFYKGGLFDHVILVTNILLEISKSINVNTININIGKPDMIRSGLYHDLGKLDTYTKKRGWETDFKFHVKEGDIGSARFHAQVQFKVKGKDPHVERCFSIMRQAMLETNSEISHAIAFHHGGWSGYRPQRGGFLASLLHSSDLIASQCLKI